MNVDLIEEGKAKAAGIISIFIGLTGFINLVCGFIYLSKGGPDGSGVWTGFGLAVITVLGILIWIKRNKTVMIFYLVMCILWFIVCIVQVIIALIAWLIWNYIRKVLEENCSIRGDSCHCTGENDVPFKVHNCDDVKVVESCFLAILLMSAFAAILTLAGSILGCITTCCAPRSQTGGVVVVQQPVGVVQPYPGQMMMVQQTAVTGYPANPQPYPPAQPPPLQGATGQMPPPEYSDPYPQKS